MKKENLDKTKINKDRIPNDVEAFLLNGGEVTSIKRGETALAGGNPSRRKFDKTLQGKKQ